MAREFTLNDFRQQFDKLERSGALGEVTLEPGDIEPARIRRILDAMSEEERSRPDDLDGPAKSRIAAASGTTVDEVENFLGQFRQVRTVMSKLWM